MSGCESVRGKWGQRCPDCGQMLPAEPGPLRSWQSRRVMSVPFGMVSGQRWTEESRAKREATFAAKRRDPKPADVEFDMSGLTARQYECLRILAKHGGRQSEAARELGISGPSMSVMVKRLRARGVEVLA